MPRSLLYPLGAAALLILAAALFPLYLSPKTPDIVERPIRFGPERKALTLAYMKEHYGINANDTTITPRIVVIHHTATKTADEAFRAFDPERLPASRGDIAGASALNVSAHFLVDRDGTIYRLMPETEMARHVIGLNWCAIGIENVGGAERTDDLTKAQLKADAELVFYLATKYPTIKYLIGHYEYRKFENSPLWKEKNPAYRTEKHDPSERFMKDLRRLVHNLRTEP